MVKVLLFNGPPECGKDTLANEMLHFTNVKFAEPLKLGCLALLYGYMPGTKEELMAKAESLKNSDIDLGITFRDFLIATSEDHMKVMFGEDVFGQLATVYIELNDLEYVVISDSGFEREAQVLIRNFGRENCALFRIHRDGKDFSKDSRSYLELPEIKSFDIDNNGTVAEAVLEIEHIIKEQLQWQTP